MTAVVMPDGKTLVSGGAEGTMKFWDLATGQERFSLTAQKAWISVAVSPDGKTIAAGDYAGNVRLFRVAHDEFALALKNELDAADPDTPAAQIAEAGTLAASGRYDAAVALLSAAIERLSKLAANPPAGPLVFDCVALAHRELGTALSRKGQPDAAEPHLRQAIAIWDKLSEQLPDDALYPGHVAYLYGYHLPEVLSARKQPREVEDALRESVARYKRIVARRPTYRNAARHLVDCGSRLIEKLEADGRHGESEMVSRDLIASVPASVQSDWYLARAESAAAKKGNQETAREYLTKAIETGGADSASGEYWFRRAVIHAQLRSWKQAVADYSKGLELVPSSPSGLNNLAWLLATCPDSSIRDPKRAAALARKAVELPAGDATYWNTLGVAEYRTGELKGAIAAMEKSVELRKGGDSFDWFFLAMAHWKLGDKTAARQWYDRAVQWMDKNQSNNEELIRFRSEAEDALELKK
jgi:tetratricopeptide (TPR) repeat protein